RMFGGNAPRVVDALKAMARSPDRLDDLYTKTAVAAGDTSTTAWAGVLAAATALGSEFAAFVRPPTIIRRLNTRRVPLNFPEGPRKLLREYIAKGRLGRKSGRGFYDYTQ